MTVNEIVDRGLSVWERGLQQPNRVAVVGLGGASITYGQLASRAHQWAHAMSTAGVEAGDTVALLAPNSVAFLEVVAAALDRILEQALLAKMIALNREMRDKLFGEFGTLGDLSAKTNLAVALGVADRDDFSLLRLQCSAKWHGIWEAPHALASAGTMVKVVSRSKAAMTKRPARVR